MLCCSSIWDILHKQIIWEKMTIYFCTSYSSSTANWWPDPWQDPWTLGDAGYAKCTHQNHSGQEGRRTPGVGLDMELMETRGWSLAHSPATFSPMQAQQVLSMSRCSSICVVPMHSYIPLQRKKEWDAIQTHFRACTIR
jgi:hypothetical protein